MASTPNERELIGIALALGARTVRGWSRAERELAARSIEPPNPTVAAFDAAISRGQDPLGDAFGTLRSAVERRPMGATYTPAPIVTAMADWAAHRTPVRVVDPGAGTGRFVVAAGRRFPNAALVAVELDPLAAVLLRGHLAAAGAAARSTVLIADYRNLSLPAVPGPTLFLGNPPYVRHHLIESRWKHWLVAQAKSLGLDASQLAGLHVHFLLATALYARSGDYGALITAAEWLDVNYGALVRQLFLHHLGGTSLHVLQPTARPFRDADTTAVISCFEVGARAPTIKVHRVGTITTLGKLEGGRPYRRERLQAAAKWTPLLSRRAKAPLGFVELGELCRVHRGQVTGLNAVWIEGQHVVGLPESVLFPTVTKARELFAAGPILADGSTLRRVIDIPADLEVVPREHRKAIQRFLTLARKLGADRGFIAQHRKAWWAVGLREPAPILATYMARRPPAFVRNLAAARHINIAHGLYPRDPLSSRVLDALARYLSTGVTRAQGRTYAGGLTKFEPKEMERLLVPSPSVLEQAPR
jgi:methylase of polypeptide subunit release factors